MSFADGAAREVLDSRFLWKNNRLDYLPAIWIPEEQQDHHRIGLDQSHSLTDSVKEERS
jgi:hypothetical protein